MKNDSDFLKNSILSNYYNFSAESDPFLISVSQPSVQSQSQPQGNPVPSSAITTNNKKKICIPINDDIMNSIKNCQFFVLFELIRFEVEQKVKPNLSLSRLNT